MSGHSKWAQIKHKKAATDAKKGTLFSKIARLIIVAAKEKGGDPAMNPRLRMEIEKARQAGMPKDNIERAIERGTGGEKESALAEVLYEAYGPGGAALLIQGVTDSKNRTTNEIKHILSEHGGKLAAQGSVEWMFEKKGVVEIPFSGESEKKAELSLALIDAGAIDIKEHADGLTAYVGSAALDTFKAELEKRAIPFSETSIAYVPKATITPSREDTEALERLFTALDDHDDIQDIATNAEESI